MRVHINPRRALYFQLALISALLLAHCLCLVSTHYFDRPTALGLVPLFHFNGESNVPTLYSSVALLVSSALLLLISAGHDKRAPFYRHWLVLSLVFLFLAIDEIAQIHEQISWAVQETLNTSGFLLFAWVIPYGILAIVLAVAYARFLLWLPRYHSSLFIGSGAIFVAGAIGFEMLGAQEVDKVAKNPVIFAAFSTVEELLEMSGIALFIYALLDYIGRAHKEVSLQFGRR